MKTIRMTQARLATGNRHAENDMQQAQRGTSMALSGQGHIANNTNMGLRITHV